MELDYRKDTNKNNLSNIAKAKKYLSWRPKILIEDGISKTIKVLNEKTTFSKCYNELL